MEPKPRRKRQERWGWKNILPVIVPFAIATLSALATACGAVEPGRNGVQTPTVLPTPIVRQIQTPTIFLPTIAPSPTHQVFPTPTMTERPTTTPKPSPTVKDLDTKPKVTCKYYSGSSSYDRLGKYLFDKYEGEKKLDESKGYSVITMKESNGNMVIFISKGGAMINFITNVIANEEALKLLPCNPEQVVQVDILIGGNNETDVSIPVSDISREIVDVSKKLPVIYQNAEVTVHLPYITQEDTKEVWNRRNTVDDQVITQLQGVKKVTVIPLSRYVVSGNTVIGDFADTLHMDPQFLLKLLGGYQSIFSFSKN